MDLFGLNWGPRLAFYFVLWYNRSMNKTDPRYKEKISNMAYDLAPILGQYTAEERREILDAYIVNYGRELVKDALKLLTERLYHLAVQAS